MPAVFGERRPDDLVVGCVGADGGDIEAFRPDRLGWPDELLIDAVEWKGIAGDDAAAVGVGDPKGEAEAAERGAEAATWFMIGLELLGAAWFGEEDVSPTAWPWIVWTEDHGVDDVDAGILGGVQEESGCRKEHNGPVKSGAAAHEGTVG